MGREKERQKVKIVKWDNCHVYEGRGEEGPEKEDEREACARGRKRKGRTEHGERREKNIETRIFIYESRRGEESQT